MDNENKILDDSLTSSEKGVEKKKFNYLKYSFSYVVLMLTVGPLMVKNLFHMNSDWWRLSVISSLYVGYALILSLVFLGGSYLVNNFANDGPKKKHKHPIWFRILENWFYSWCFIIFFVYMGIKFF